MTAATAVAAAIVAVVPRASAAQSNWTANITVQPFPSPFIADWQRNPITALLNVVYSGTGAQDVRIEGYVKNAQRGELARVSSRQLSFAFGPVSQIFNAADILDWATVSKNQQYTDLVLRTGMLPEGKFDMCAEVLNNQNAMLARACSSFTIALPDPPQLIFPTRGAVIAGLQPVFQWTPVRAPIDVGVGYRVRVVEIFAGQTPEDAIASNPSWFESDVSGGAPVLVYPVDALPLDNQKQYAWRVEARDADGNALTRGGRASEIWSFSLGGAARPPGAVASGTLPDEIDLVPGVAKLKGLRAATVEDGVATYVVNGKVQLEIAAPASFSATVDANDLAIDKISLATLPRVTGGSVSGSVDLSAFPTLGGGFTKFRQIEYTPTGGLTLAANLELPGSDPVPLNGTVQLTAAGLYGSLQATALPGKPLGSYGSDPARLIVQRARAEFPAGSVELVGDVELFKKDVACSGVTATLDAQGVLGAQVSCTPREPVGLTAAGDRAQLSLLTLTGNFAFDTKASALTYDLSTQAQLKLDARPGGANCGASLSLALKNGSVNVGQFTPRCDASEGESSLGWLTTRLSSLSLKKFSYAAGTGFDFELQVDLMPWLPDIPGFKLPTVAAVSITQNGLAIPSVDVAMTEPAFILAGFGVQVKRLRLPAFTLSWAKWELRSASDFAFNFDAELTLPKIAGEAACLTAQPVTITNAVLSQGRFRMTLADRTFTPACGITLRAEESKSLSDIPLTEAATATAQQAGSATGGGGGGGGGAGGCGGSMMAITICKTLNQMAMGNTDPCGNTIPDSWGEPDAPTTGSTTERKCGSGPWKKVEQPKPIPDWAPPSVLTQEKLDQRAEEKKQAAKDAQAKLDAALDDPKCTAAALADPATKKQCADALAKAKKEADDAYKTYSKALQDKYFSKKAEDISTCLGLERQKELLGVSEKESNLSNCTDVNRDSISAVLKKLMVPPPNMTIEQKRSWCGLAPAAVAMNLSWERTLELTGTANKNGMLADVQAGLDECAKQASWDLQSSCKNGGTPARLQTEVAAVLGYSRQQQMTGSSESSEGLINSIQDCQAITNNAKIAAAAAAAAGTTTSMLDPPRLPTSVAAAFGGDGDTTPLSPLPGPTQASSTTNATTGFEVRLELERFGGEFDIGFYPFFVVNKIPEIQGNIVLPSIFQCTDATGQKPPITGKLRLGPRGEINASVLGFIPACPVDLAAVQLTVTKSELTFSTADGQQSLQLAGGVSAKFTAGSSTATGTGLVAIDLLNAKLIDGNVTFKGPFDLGLPREKPIVTFSLNSAVLDPTGIHIDGRADLIFGQGQKIGTTFDKVTINPVAAAITDGRILFDASFGLEVGVAKNGDLAWGATPNGAPLSVQSGVRIDLPSQIVLGKTGFSIAGDGGARLLYEGRDVANLVTKFSPGFALGTNPVGVASGMVDFQLNGVSMAFIDRTGFHPNLAYFASAILPSKLPLPSEQVAYLELRDASNNLRVTTENTGQGLRIYTPAGGSVPLVIPALQAGRASAPRIDVTFDLTLDPLGKNVALGRIAANVPSGDLAAFDLSAYGLPFAVQTLAYDRAAGGAYQWTLAGALMLFNRPTGASATDRIALSLDGSGRLMGAVNLSPNQVVPLVQSSQSLTLTLQTISGSFDADLPAKQFKFTLSAAAALDLVLSAQESYKAGATLTISDLGVKVDNLTYANASGADVFKYLDLSALQLGLANMRIPELSYTAAGGFKFRMLFDAAVRFPSLKNLTLPPIKDIELTNAGFSIPAYDAPELNLGTAAALGDNATMTADGPLDLGGFALNVKAFRMSRVDFNWFTGQGPTNWGFGFDLELGLGNLVADAPQSLKDMRVQILNAGFRNGRFYGTVERLAFPTPLNIGVGKLYAISGSLPDPATSAANVPFSLTAEMELTLGAVLPVCQGGETQLSKPNTTISIYGDGWFSGTIDGLVPNCPMDAGPFKFRFDQSKVVFGYGNTTGANGARERTLEFDVAATVTFPGVTEGSVVTASGNVKFDLLQQKWIDGRIDVQQPFVYKPPDNNPYLTFAVNSASLDATGLHFTGGGSLQAKDGANIGVQFNNLTFSIPNFQVTAGSVTFNSSFAIGVAIAQGGMQWGVFSPTAPRPEGNSFRFIVPQSVTIDGSGLAISGTATAELAFSDKTYNTLQIAFVNGFKVGFSPLAVTSGRANFILGSDEIAHVDNTGFWPGNVFGVLPIPAKLGLPTEDVAYVELRDAQNTLLIETQTSATGLQLRTKANTPVRLVVPGLAGQGGGGPPAVNVSFDVVVNPSTWQFVSGFVRAEAVEGAQPLMSLESLGIPLTLRKIAFENVGNNVYGLRAAGRFQLPESLNNLKVDVPNLVITGQGLWGDVQMGAYLAEYTGPNAPAPPVLIGTSFMGDTIKIDVTGAKLHFGSGANFALKGQITSKLFKKDGQDPTVIKWSGAVTTQSTGGGGGGFSLQLDEMQNGFKLPIAVAEYEPKSVGNEPALLISADAQEFKVRTSGVLTVPTMSNSFALTIAGLQLGTKGVVFPTISIQGVSSQELDLFGAKFRLKDSLSGAQVVYPALKVANDNGVFSVALSGEVEFMENTSRFWGLKVASNGQVSLAGANLLDKPLNIVENYFAIDKATIANNTLRVDVSVTLPSPLDGPGAQKAWFAVNTNGQVSGGATIALINEAPSLTPSGSGTDFTHFNFGVATVHLRYLALQLDFANLKSNSSVQVVSDFYLQNKAENIIKLGDTNGGTVQPGLKIGFDGNVTWGTVKLAGNFGFDFDVVKLNITQVSLPPVTNGFAIAISGKLSLNVSAVSGSLDFQDFTVGSNGVTFSPSGLKGGELTIADVLHVQLSDVGYSGSPTTITIKGGGLPSVPTAGSQVGATDPSTAEKTVPVNSFISFGGRISVMDVFDGGVERFLFYKGTDNTTHLLIQKATVKIMDIVDFTADFKYDETLTGFEMFMGAEGHIMTTFDIVVVGAFAQEATLTRAGMFVMLRGLQIQIGPYVTIKGLGGGFFLNPRPEWLEYVRVKAKVSQTAGAYIAAPPSTFAVLLFGEAGIIRPELVTGRILITVSDTYFRMDGAVEILSQGDRFKGDFHVQIAFTETNVQGNIAFQLDYGGVVNAKGYLDIYVQSETLWGVYGKASAKIIAMLDGGAEIMIGPAGFYFDGNIQMGYDIWIIKLTGFMEAKMWFISASKNWGAYVKVGVEASVLGGLAYARGTLHGLILFETSPSLFAAASLEVSCPVGKWEGWAWVKFQNSQMTAGLGKDDALMDAIAKAENVASDMQNAKDESQTAINDAKSVAPAAVALTNAELATAYKNIQAWDSKSFIWMLILLDANEINGEVKLSPAAKQTEDAYRGWYYGVLRRDGLPGDTTKVVQYTSTVTSLFSGLEASRPQVEQRIATLGMSIQQLNPLSASAVAFADPVRAASQPTFQSQTDAKGNVTQVLTGAPTLDVDEGTAASQTTVAKMAQQQIEANDLRVRQQIAALEGGLIKLRAVTTSGDAAALPSLVGQYAAVASQAERQFATQADVILGRQDWMRARLADLAAKDAGVTTWVNGKTSSLAASQSSADYTTLAAMTRVRVQFLVAFSGNQQLLTDYDAKVGTLTSATKWAFMTAQANTSGHQLFYEIASSGMADADAKADAGFTTLVSDANTRLGTIRQAHASLSAALDKLYQVQADATGALYDLYDRYLFLKTGVTPTAQTSTASSGGTIILSGGILGGAMKGGAAAGPTAPSVDDIANVNFAQQRFNQLAQDLTVPKLNAVSVTATGLSRYTAQLQFAWSGWHPSGTYEFRFRDFDPAAGGGGNTPFYSNGTAGTLTSYRFTPNRSVASTTTRTVDVGARGGAGFTGFGRANYTLSFLQGANTNASVSGGGLVTDATPPSIPVVTFPQLGQKMNAAGEIESWTRNPTAVNAAWSARDDESGVSEYQYALWNSAGSTATLSIGGGNTFSTSTAATSSNQIRPFASVGGREQVNIDRLNLTSGTPVYVAVKAKNGQNLTGGIGVSTVLRYDATPPLWSAGAISPVPPTVLSAGGDKTSSACPVLQPPYPAAPLMPMTVLIATAWGGTLAAAPTGTAPSVAFNVPAATDGESGLAGYTYRVTSQPESTYTGSGWQEISARAQYVVAQGEPLDYSNQFYVAIAPRNLAGGVGKPLVYGPFRAQDPSPPTRATLCAAVAGPGVISVQFTTDSKDDETGVTGYQYRVRTSSTKTTELTKSGGRDYPAKLSTIDWTTGGSMVRNTAPLTLTDGQQYYVDVRAINGQSMTSAQAISGPILYDVSAPPAPSASLSWGALTGGMQELVVSLTAPTDPHSGLTTLQYTVGTTATASDVIPWTSQAVAAGASPFTLRIPAVALNTSRYLRFRTVNGAGVPSVVATASITNPQVVTIIMPLLLKSP